MMRPLIAITGSTKRSPLSTHKDFLVRYAYADAIRQAGGDPVMLHTLPPSASVIEGKQSFDGILFSGGGDIDPTRYGDKMDDRVLGVEDARDELEIAWFKVALVSGIPFLGICRGLQLVNIALGGSLFHDLGDAKLSFSKHDWSPSRSYPAHSIRVSSTSILGEVGFSTGSAVNSLHHQGIQVLGDSLAAAAWSLDGLVEAVELSGHPFGLAVQWHPEWLVHHPSSKSLFRAFIRASM